MIEQDNSDVGYVQFDGPRTLRTVDATHETLLDALNLHPVLEIDCDGIEDVDLSFVQLLLAARASARRDAKTIRLRNAATGALRTALERGGFFDGEAAERAFWLATEQV